jgi:hypothetical protein
MNEVVPLASPRPTTELARGHQRQENQATQTTTARKDSVVVPELGYAVGATDVLDTEFGGGFDLSGELWQYT